MFQWALGKIAEMFFCHSCPSRSYERVTDTEITPKRCWYAFGNIQVIRSSFLFYFFKVGFKQLQILALVENDEI